MFGNDQRAKQTDGSYPPAHRDRASGSLVHQHELSMKLRGKHNRFRFAQIDFEEEFVYGPSIADRNNLNPVSCVDLINMQSERAPPPQARRRRRME